MHQFPSRSCAQLSLLLACSLSFLLFFFFFFLSFCLSDVENISFGGKPAAGMGVPLSAPQV